MALENSIPSPRTYITDYSKAAKFALEKHFPESQPQLCFWHILKNCTKYIKDNWAGPRPPDDEIQPGTEPIADQVITEDSTNPEASIYNFDRRNFTYSPRRLLAMWKAMAWVHGKGLFRNLWAKLKDMFSGRQQSEPLTSGNLFSY